MPFYTDHPGYQHTWALQSRFVSDGDLRFHDPELEATQDWVWMMALDACRAHGEWVPPAYLAHACQLPSANAATFAALAGLERSGRSYSFATRFYGDYSASPDEDEYEPPQDPTEDGAHMHPWCQCSECFCECGECGCSVCYPDGADDCENSSCEYHHPDCDSDCGTCHPDGCDCSSCYPDDDDSSDYDSGENSFDDQDDNDDYEGRAAMPEPPPGRCRFGIEVEFNSGNRHSIAQQLVSYGVACQVIDYTHVIVPYWKMTTDSTVSGGEIVSPILAGDDRSIEEVREVLRVVKLNGGSTGRNVGMHVHLDVTPFETPELQALVHNLRTSEKLFAGFVPKHRYDGSNGNGAALIRPRSWEAIESWIVSVNPEHRARTMYNRTGSCPLGRSVSFNFNSLLTYGTVECRLLGHTLNTVKVRTWIRALQSVIEASAQQAYMPTCDGLAWLGQFGLEAEHAAHFREVVISRGRQDWLVCEAA